MKHISIKNILFLTTIGVVLYLLSFTLHAASIPAITSPVPGSMISSSEQTFTIDYGGTATVQQQLIVGTYASGSDIFDGLLRSSRSQKVTGIPLTGQNIHVWLMWQLPGRSTWQVQSYEYKTSPQQAIKNPAITFPSSNTILTSSTQEFVINYGTASSLSHLLRIGTYAGGDNISGGLLYGATSKIINTIPINGTKIYATLSWLNPNTRQWNSSNYEYQTAGQQQASSPKITFPSNGSLITSTSQEFIINHDGKDNVHLAVGVGSAGNGALYSSYISNDRVMVNGFLRDGRNIYARLSWKEQGSNLTKRLDYSYRMDVEVIEIDTVAPVITLQGSNPVQIQKGASYNDAGATAVDNVDGSVAVTYSHNINSNYVGNYTYTYKAIDSAGNTSTATRTVNVVDSSTTNVSTQSDNSILYIKTPTLDSDITASTQTFEVTEFPPIGTKLSAEVREKAKYYYIEIGNSLGSSDIFTGNVLSVNQKSIAYNIPTDGRKIYVRLYWGSDNKGAWNKSNYIYNRDGYHAQEFPENSLIGLDNDHDGIRDDVGNYIKTNYLNNINLKKDLEKYAFYDRAFSIAAESKNREEAISAINKVLNSASCIRYKHGSNSYTSNIDEMTDNSLQRYKERIKHSSLVSGQVFSSMTKEEKRLKCK